MGNNYQSKYGQHTPDYAGFNKLPDGMKEFEAAMNNNEVVNSSSYDYDTAADVVSGMDGNVWKSYADAEAAGFSNIRTPHEFLRGGDDKVKYGTYQNYLAAMYKEKASSKAVVRAGVKFYDDAWRTGFETVGNNYRVVDDDGNKYRIESAGVVDNPYFLKLASDVANDEVFAYDGQIYIKRDNKIFSIVKRTGTNGSEYKALVNWFNTRGYAGGATATGIDGMGTPPAQETPAAGTGTPSTPEVTETPTANGGAAEGVGSTAGGEISAAGDGNGGSEEATGNTGGEGSEESGGGGSGDGSEGGTGYTAEEFRALAKEWGKSEGIDYDAQRQEQITAAESEYARSLTTYGEKAEQLGQMGLTGSGFSDNLERDAYAAKQQALSEIEKNYRNNEEGLIAKYKEYLETNEIAPKETQNKANAAVYDILAKNEGLSLGAVRLQLMALGYSEAEADSAVATYRETTNAQYETMINTAVAAGSWASLPDKKTLDTMVAADQLTREAADVHLADVQTKLNDACLLAVGNESEAEKFLAGFGVTLEDGQNLSDVLFAKIDELHAAGQLTDAQYNSILLDNIKRDLKKHRGDVGAIAEIAYKINLGEGFGTEENKQAAFAEVAEALGISKDGIIAKTRNTTSAVSRGTCHELQVGEIKIRGTKIAAPYGIDTNENVVKEGNVIYAKDDSGDWFRFTTEDEFVSDGTKFTQEQKDAVFAIIATVLDADRDTFRILNSTKKGNEWEDEDGDGGKLVVGDDTYRFRMDEYVDIEDEDKINDAFSTQLGRAPQEGDAMVFNGRVVVVTSNGQLRYAKKSVWDSVPFESKLNRGFLYGLN